ncbi:hypothetical protein V8E51_013517 [Hyaloscypha variabilis]
MLTHTAISHLMLLGNWYICALAVNSLTGTRCGSLRSGRQLAVVTALQEPRLKCIPALRPSTNRLSYTSTTSQTR